MTVHLTKRTRMKTSTTRTIAKVITLSLLTATVLHATNGDSLIAVGAKSRGMGGTGIALSHGAESSLSNPALITSVEGTEISFGGTLFMPDISTQLGGSPNPMLGGFFNQENYRSDANRNIIPEVSIAHKINENWYIGAGMFGTAGMGTDFRNAGTIGGTPTGFNYANFNMVTNLQLLQFAVPVAYKYEGLSVAISAILQYGNLDINYALPTGQTGSAVNGAGLAQDFGMGWNAGVSYDFDNGLILGAMYKSAIEMTYGGQISTASAPFNQMIAGANSQVVAGGGPANFYNTMYDGDILEQPAEYGVGFSYNAGQHTFAFDYKKIKWSDTEGYGDFGWDDQDVYAFGYQYSQDNWALRVGYNYASSAVVELTGATQMDPTFISNSANNFFNLLGFPATAEKHYTFGGTYNLTEAFGIDIAYVYSPTVTKTFDTSAFGATPPNGFALTSITNTHQEDSISFQLTYKF